MIRLVTALFLLLAVAGAHADEKPQSPARLTPFDALALEAADLRVALAQCERERKAYELKWRYQLVDTDSIDPKTLAIIHGKPSAPPPAKSKVK